MLAKLGSRKLWVTVVGAALVAFADGLGFQVTEAQIYALMGMVMTYLGAQGMVDARNRPVSTPMWTHDDFQPPKAASEAPTEDADA